MIFYVTSISYINPYFRAPSPLKPLKSSPRYENLPGDFLIACFERTSPWAPWNPKSVAKGTRNRVIRRGDKASRPASQPAVHLAGQDKASGWAV